MGTDPLVVRIMDTRTGQSWVYVFSFGPVSVGCGADSTLQIARPFVVPRHGAFVFDDRSVHYQDLDPRSGTRVDSAPASGKEWPLTEWTRIQIGDLHITISRRPPAGPVPHASLSPFATAAAGSGRRGRRDPEPEDHSQAGDASRAAADRT